MSEYDVFNVDYSMKNIPISANDNYMIKIIDQTRNLLRRMRLKAYFFDNMDANRNEDTENYGFPSNFNPPPNKNLIPFENDMIKMVENLEFRMTQNDFQKKLSDDIKKIKRSGKVLVAADKTTNMYTMKKDDYNKLLDENISKDYKKSNKDEVKEINKEAIKVTQELPIFNRIRALPLKDAFITMKDHKSNFKSHPKCRLLNPTKSEIGKISKSILEKINKEIKKKSKLTQWTNTDEVIKWFVNLEKGKYQFLKFDVVSFYPNISEKLLDEALEFAKKFTKIEESDIAIIKNACKSVLHSKGESWVRNNTKNLFDITMGGFHGAEVCELVGLLLLDRINPLFSGAHVGLYRDDGIAAIPKMTARRIDILKRELHASTKSLGLNIEIEAPLIKTEFLDVVFDLQNHKFSPYRKPNSEIRYVNAKSNHPPAVLKEIPNMIVKRLSKRSSDASEFEKVADTYQKALKTNGFETKMEFINENAETVEKKRRRKRKIIWYNPPFCQSVKTNIGRRFINLVKKHFSKDNPLSKIFNRHNMRISYSRMENMKEIVSAHNKKILNHKTRDDTLPCNCKHQKCPMSQGSCRQKNIVYQATVESNSGTANYIGLTAMEFKDRWAAHKTSFKYKEKRDSTELSKYIWELKEKGEDYNISVKAIARAKQSTGENRTCRLCLKEILLILKNYDNCINLRKEFMGTCRHRRKFLLTNSV